jgi:hypothetical protein
LKIKGSQALQVAIFGVFWHLRNGIIWQQNLNGCPTFSATANSLELVPTLSDVGRQPEIAMAAYKPEVVILRNYMRYQRDFNGYWAFSTTTNKMELSIANIVRCRPTSDRQPEIAMAASKTEVVISQERNDIAAKYQRPPHIFGHG